MCHADELTTRALARRRGGTVLRVLASPGSCQPARQNEPYHRGIRLGIQQLESSKGVRSHADLCRMLDISG